MSQDWTTGTPTYTNDASSDITNTRLMFEALRSFFSGSSAPASPVAGQPWFDTTNHIFKIRNEANSAWLSVWDLTNDKAVDAQLLDGLNSGNSSGNIPVSNGTVNTNLNADKLDGYDAGNGSGNVPVSNGTVCANLNADTVDGLHGSQITELTTSLFTTMSGQLFGTERFTSTTYTNSSGKPMLCMISCTDTEATGGINVTINGSARHFNNLGGAFYPSLTFIVPNGMTYRVVTSAANWYEFT